jgi:peroxiredoxin
MSIHALLLTGLAIGAPSSAPSDAAPVPKLERGVEITWRGTFSEAVLRPNVRAFRSYEVETRAFVWDISDHGADIALLTSIKYKPDVKTIPDPSPIVRLHLARVQPNGKLMLLGADALDVPADKRQTLTLPALQIEGLPTFEAELFLTFPAEKLTTKMKWEAPEAKRPTLTYRLEGIDSVHGARCWKISAGQQTDDWDRPHTGKEAWRRGETLWVSAAQGYAARLERTIEKSDPQTGELGFRSKLVCEHVGQLTYRGRFGEDRKEEIFAAARFMVEFDRLAANPGREGPRAFEGLLQQIDQHITTHITGEAVPYRVATLGVQRKAEAAKRGHLPPAPPPTETPEPTTLTINRPAADIVAKDLVRGESVRLSNLRGKPVVLIYYQPSSAKTAEPVLRFADTLQARHGHHAAILPLAIGNSEAALAQRNELKVAVSVLAGRDVYRTHGVESAPLFAVLDKDGRVRSITLGWSDDNVAAVRAELEKLVK